MVEQTHAGYNAAMANPPRLKKTDAAELHELLAASEERAAEAFASELSVEKDPKVREWLGRKAKHNKDQAAFHREIAAKLREESR